MEEPVQDFGQREKISQFLVGNTEKTELLLAQEGGQGGVAALPQDYFSLLALVKCHIVDLYFFFKASRFGKVLQVLQFLLLTALCCGKDVGQFKSREPIKRTHRPF